MTVSEIFRIWNLFMTRRSIPVYTAVYTTPCLKLRALPKGIIEKCQNDFRWLLSAEKAASHCLIAWNYTDLFPVSVH